MAESAVNVDQIIEAMTAIRVSRFTSGAAVTFALYDWFLVFGQEYKTIYRSKWSFPKVLFFAVRLITPPGLILGTMQLVDFRPALSKERCNNTAIFLMFALLTSVFASHGLFTLRLIALYKNSTYMVWFIATFYIATYIATYGITIASAIFLINSETFYSDLLHICASLSSTQLAAPIWYAPAAFETFLFSLTAYRAVRDAKVISGPSSAPLLVLLYRDGMIAFLVMTGARVWNIWICLTQPASSLLIGAMLMWATNTVLTTRVYMNLVWTARKPYLTTGAFTGASLGFRVERNNAVVNDTYDIETRPGIEMRIPTLGHHQVEEQQPDEIDNDQLWRNTYRYADASP